MPVTLTIDAAAEAIQRAARAGNGRVLVPGGAMEALALQDAFLRRPELAAGLVFAGLPVPGVNRFDWAVLDPAARMEVCLPSPDWAQTLADGRTRLFPMHYSAFYPRLVAVPPAVQVLHLSRPDRDGRYTMGWSGDLAAGPARYRIGLVNAAIPPVGGAPRVAPEVLDAVVPVDHPPVTVGAGAGGPPDLVRAVAGLVPDGATVQIGIGRLPGAILASLKDHKRLNIHSGLAGSEVAALLDAGAIAPDGVIRTGLVLGDAAFLARMAGEPRLQIAPVPVTHGHTSLAAITGLIAINAALEADLCGQLNCEWAGARRVAGVGGAIDFLRGARASPGGRAITVIQAQGRDGASRIVPRLTAPTVSVARADADTLVTEFGVAELRDLAEPELQAAIAALAPPAARASLLAEAPP